jgi:hypothetical protein
MDASGFAYQHSRLRLCQRFRATDELRNSAVLVDDLSGLLTQTEQPRSSP